jgi:hypothetical protein
VSRELLFIGSTAQYLLSGWSGGIWDMVVLNLGGGRLGNGGISELYWGIETNGKIVVEQPETSSPPSANFPPTPSSR